MRVKYRPIYPNVIPHETDSRMHSWVPIQMRIMPDLFGNSIGIPTGWCVGDTRIKRNMCKNWSAPSLPVDGVITGPSLSPSWCILYSLSGYARESRFVRLFFLLKKSQQIARLALFFFLALAISCKYLEQQLLKICFHHLSLTITKVQVPRVVRSPWDPSQEIGALAFSEGKLGSANIFAEAKVHHSEEVWVAHHRCYRSHGGGALVWTEIFVVSPNKVVSASTPLFLWNLFESAQ